MKVDKVIIVGGGSAGWMTAATFIKAFPNKDISVIESPDVPAIGVGESTLGQFKKWARYVDIDEKDFIPFTDANYKYSIQFTDFYKKDSGSFHYPFGWPDNDEKQNGSIQNWMLAREFFPEAPQTDMVDFLFPAAQLWKKNKFYDNADGRLGNFNSNDFISYQFDAVKFGKWLKEKYCVPRGVKHIEKHVVNVDLDENGVNHLLMNDGEKIYSDLFIDCTGFKSLILGQSMKEPFISYENILPNNSAWACQIPYKDKYKELQLFTNCTAIGNGWCWNIPLWSRLGTGYNYSDKYISDEDALKEFKDYLVSDKMLIPRTKEEIESFTYRNLKTKIGTYNRTFVKNVVAIGLSSGFIEPLESNGLYSVHEFLFKLIDILQRGNISQFDRNMYNIETRDMFDGFAKFVATHYSMSHRDDTKYWQDIMDKDFLEEMNGKLYVPYMHRTNGYYQIGKNLWDIWSNYNETEGSLYIMTGMNYRPLGGTKLREFYHVNEKTNIEKTSKTLYQNWKERAARWEGVANEAPHILDYLAKNFYNK